MTVIRRCLLCLSRLHLHTEIKLTTASLNAEKNEDFTGNSNYKSRGVVISLCKQGRLTEALKILYHLGIDVDSFTYASLLHGCVKDNALAKGKLVHANIIQTGLEKCPDIFLWKTLLNMYAKCGNMVDARKVFDQMPDRDVVSWTMMVAGYAQNGLGDKALEVFYEMKEKGVEPNVFSFASALPACAGIEALEQGKKIHEEVIMRGLQYNVFVGNALVDMYAKCGFMEIACEVFDKMPQRNLVTWNVLVGGYVHNGLVEEALEVFWNMPEKNVISCNAMIAGCAQNGLVEEAMRIFWAMPWRDVVSWTAIIAGYAKNGCGDEVLRLFREMQLADTFESSLVCVDLRVGFHNSLLLGQQNPTYGCVPEGK